MHLEEVNTPELEDTFLQVHVDCNKHCENWIRPLDRDIKAVFDKNQNKAFRYGEATRWVLFDDRNLPVGRIAAFVHRKYKNKGDTIPVGGIGFFDCYNDTSYSRQLFSQAQEWLDERGMQAMDGPINFGERDKWWGLLVEGFNPPIYGMNFNPPYYQDLFEDYGFKNFYNQICWSIPVANDGSQLPQRFYEEHRKFAEDGDFKATRIRKNDKDRFVHDFCTVYNKAWAQHQGNKEMKEEQASRIYHSMKPILDEDLLWFAYYKGQPVAMWISIPDINQAIKGLNGKFHLINKLRFVINRWRGVCDRLVGIIYGVVPEFQSTGVDYFMIVEAEKVIKAKGKYKEAQLQWQGDFNPKMLNISRHMGAEQSSRLVTYRYLFDQNMPFHRHPVVV